MSTTANLLVDLEAGVLRVTLNRPEQRNALNRAVLAGLGAAFGRYADDNTVRVAVLTAAGDKSFAAGGDLKELSAIRTRQGARKLNAEASAALDRIRRFPVPVVAALNGTALGGGAELAVACDFRIASAHAGIGFVQGKLNISTGFGGGADLMRLVGPSRALLLLCRSAVLSADEAGALGLIDAVAARDEPLAALVARFIEPLARQAPQVMRAFKAQAIAERWGLARAERAAIEQRHFSLTWAHDDHWTAADKVLARQRS